MGYNQYRLFEGSLFPRLIENILKGNLDDVQRILYKLPRLKPKPPHQQKNLSILMPILSHGASELTMAAVQTLVSVLRIKQPADNDRQHIEKILKPLQLPLDVIDMIIQHPVILALIVCTPTPTGISNHRANILVALYQHNPIDLESLVMLMPEDRRENINNGLLCLAATQDQCAVVAY